MAKFRASFTMVHIMLTTLFATGITNVGTQLANGIGMFAFQAHELCRRPANGGAFHIQLYAFCHCIHIIFFQTSGRAIITSRCTFQASINAGLICLIHTDLLLVYHKYQTITKKLLFCGELFILLSEL